MGGVLFGSAFSQADSGQRYANYWPSGGATVVAQADPRPVPRPAPPAPPTPPTPPRRSGGVSVQIHDGKVQIDGVNDLVDGAIHDAQDAIKTSGLPADVRDKLQKRLDKVKDAVKNRLSHLDANNLDQLGDELSKMGDDIGKQMDEFGKEMEKYGKQVGKDSMKNFGKGWSGHGGHFRWDGNSNTKDKDKDDDEDNDESDLPSAPDVDDTDELDDAVRSLGDLSLKPPQRDQIQKLRADSDRQVAAAKKQLDQASDTLQKQLENAATSDADISRSIDAVTQQEAAIRKARILAWHGARRVLDDAQRKKVEDVKPKRGH
ncbi:MAG: hypothetical protein ABI591_10495 [Kofleriaceae bacterium]